METNDTVQTPPPSGNLTEADLAARFRKVNSPAATPTTKSPAPGAPSPEKQPEPETPEAADANTPEPPAEPEEPETPENPKPETPEQPETPASEDPTAEQLAEATNFEELRALIPKDKKALATRVHELLGDRKAARDEAEALRTQVQEMQGQLQQLQTGTPPQLTTVDRFSGHPAVQQIDQQLTAVDECLAWCDANPDGGELSDGKGGTTPVSREQMLRMKRTAEKDRTTHTVARAHKVAAIEAEENARREQADALTLKHYAWMGNQQSPEFQLAVKIGQKIPGLLQSPEAALILGDAVRGQMLREAAAKAKAVPAKPRAHPPNIATAAAAAPKVSNTLESAVQLAEQEYKARPTGANYQKLHIAQDRLKASRQSRAA